MKHFALAALALAAAPRLALAAPQAATIAVAPAAAVAPQGQEASTHLAMRRERLAPGGRLAEHRSEGERYLFVVSGRLKVSDLVTGDEQVVEAGRMAAERPGDWHVAQALGSEPVTVYVIDRVPAPAAGGGH